VGSAFVLCVLPIGMPSPPGPIPTLIQLHRAHRWVYLHCRATGCYHSRAVTLVRYMIVWSPHASSERLRRLSRCSRCGALGASTYTPSFIDSNEGVRGWPPEADGC
jgi:hypothetical protein